MMNLLAILTVIALVLFWLDSARARELATAIAQAACNKAQLQFLDDTVSLARMGLRRTPEGLRLRRMFRFDHSNTGNQRNTGYVILIGTRLELLDLGLPEQAPAPEREAVTPEAKSTVIKFPSDRRR